ncbi:MAG TPA: hypothetical protein PKV67_00045 [Hyphomonas sp.]|nr:hypothetical protein [Hyphomonas sp.]HRI99135.1 hypothetical protein [Hyphomonas sp.]HRK68678.1 hypothetical protein [Hyphomonas sp.]
MHKFSQIAAALAASALAACATANSESASPKLVETGSMLTVITSGDAETQLMALILTKSAKAAG